MKEMKKRETMMALILGFIILVLVLLCELLAML